MEKTYHGRDGTPVPASLTVIPFRLGDGSMVVAYFSQIERIKQFPQIAARPEASDWTIFFTLIGKYKKSFLLGTLVFALISAEVRNVAFREGKAIVSSLLGWQTEPSTVDTPIE